METALADALACLDSLPAVLESLRTFYGEDNYIFKFALRIYPFAKVEAEQLCLWAEEGALAPPALYTYRNLQCLELLEQIKPSSFNCLLEFVFLVCSSLRGAKIERKRLELLILLVSSSSFNIISELESELEECEKAELLSIVCDYNETILLEYLLEFPEFISTLRNTNSSFFKACEKGHVAVVERLLLVCNLSSAGHAIRLAAENGHVAVVELLLKDPRVNPSTDDNLAIQCASERGHVAVVDRLLQDGRVDPSACNNYAIQMASLNGHVAVVDRLLQDGTGRVDPSANDNCAIQWASEKGHVAVVDRLLQDGRVDPSADNNYAIRYASANGHKEIVKMLKNDPRCTLNFFQKLFY